MGGEECKRKNATPVLGCACVLVVPASFGIHEANRQSSGHCAPGEKLSYSSRHQGRVFQPRSRWNFR